MAYIVLFNCFSLSLSLFSLPFPSLPSPSSLSPSPIHPALFPLYQTSINLVQFVDFLTPKATREEAIEVFNDLDSEGEGLVDITSFLSVRGSSRGNRRRSLTLSSNIYLCSLGKDCTGGILCSNLKTRGLLKQTLQLATMVAFFGTCVQRHRSFR